MQIGDVAAKKILALATAEALPYAEILRLVRKFPQDTLLLLPERTLTFHLCSLFCSRQLFDKAIGVAEISHSHSLHSFGLIMPFLCQARLFAKAKILLPKMGEVSRAASKAYILRYEHPILYKIAKLFGKN